MPFPSDTAPDTEVEDLRGFEREYRSRLKSYFTEQLAALDGVESGDLPDSGEGGPKRLKSILGGQGDEAGNGAGNEAGNETGNAPDDEPGNDSGNHPGNEGDDRSGEPGSEENPRG